MARIILNQLNCHVAKNTVPESQCGFRAGRGTRYMIFAIGQLQEVQKKCKEQNKGLAMVFINLTKA